MAVLRVSTCGRACLDRHLFAHRTHLQTDIDSRVGVDLQHDTGLHVLAETFLGDFDLIRTDGKIGKHVTAVGSAGRITDRAGRSLRRFDRRARNGRAARIFYDAVDLRRLSPADGSTQCKTHRDDSDYADSAHSAPLFLIEHRLIFIEPRSASG